MVGIIFGLGSAVLLAIGQTCLKSSLQTLPASISFYLETLCGLLLWVPFALVVGINFSQLPMLLPYVIISAVLSEAYYFYIHSKGNLMVIGTVLATYPIYTVIFAKAINNEHLSLQLVLFIVLTIIGVIVVTSDGLHKIKDNIQAALWATSGAVAIGFSDSISKNAIDQSTAASFLFLLAFVQLPIALIFLKLEKQHPLSISSIKSEFPKYKTSLYAALLIALSMICFWLTFQFTYTAVASTITATNVMFMMLFAAIVFKTKLTANKVLGVAVIIIGILSIGIIT